MKRFASLRDKDFWKFVCVMALISLGAIGLVVLAWWLVIRTIV